MHDAQRCCRQPRLDWLRYRASVPRFDALIWKPTLCARPSTGYYPQRFNKRVAMDRTSNDDSAKNTKVRLLDAAEKLYTRSGQDSLSLRDLTELAGVNLAAVNYHFGSKNALVCAMVARRLDVINELRIAELSHLEKTLRDDLRCEHIFAALAKSMMQPGFDIVESPEQCDFAIRISTDLSEPLRHFLSQRYAHVETRYIAAFCRTTPWLNADEVTWQVNCLAFALPGIGLNANTLLLLRKAYQERGMSKVQALASLAATVSALLNAPPSDTDHVAMMHSIFAGPQPVAA